MELAPKRAGFAPERINRITEHLEKNYIQPGKVVGCQTLVARHGHVAYFKSQGLMDRERRTPMADDTVFRLYSMTKRNVLSHTGGLTYGATNHPVDRVYREVGVGRGDGETLSGFAEKLAKVPLRYQPGERWMYSLSTDVCGCLVEAISGKRFDQYLQETIFDPLDMKDTSFMVASRKADRFAANYQREADKTLKLIDDPERSNYLKQP